MDARAYQQYAKRRGAVPMNPKMILLMRVKEDMQKAGEWDDSEEAWYRAMDTAEIMYEGIVNQEEYFQRRYNRPQ